MATFSFDDIELDEGDEGLVWIDGLGFRGANECTLKEPMQSRKYEPPQYECTDDFVGGKYDLDLIPEVYDVEDIYAAPYVSEIYVPEYISQPGSVFPDWEPIPTGTPVWDYECCKIITVPEPVIPEVAPVPLPTPFVLLVAAILLMVAMSRQTKGNLQ
ncbi:hypothetical protein [Sulfitobacter phage vB_SupP_AX]|nr:hypothetical protein [Sulfitobacter phage vB_SupP_AX]